MKNSDQTIANSKTIINYTLITNDVHNIFFYFRQIPILCKIIVQAIHGFILSCHSVVQDTYIAEIPSDGPKGACLCGFPMVHLRFMAATVMRSLKNICRRLRGHRQVRGKLIGENPCGPPPRGPG